MAVPLGCVPRGDEGVASEPCHCSVNTFRNLPRIGSKKRIYLDTLPYGAAVSSLTRHPMITISGASGRRHTKST